VGRTVQHDAATATIGRCRAVRISKERPPRLPFASKKALNFWQILLCKLCDSILLQNEENTMTGENYAFFMETVEK